jgi:hypothetical protein
VRRFTDRGRIDPGTDPTALELACYALQLPLKSSRLTAMGRPGRTTLRDRAEQAAEMLVGLVGDDKANDALLDQSTELLVEVHQRNPESEQARLLADALSLEDFGVIGIVAQTVALARQGGGVSEVANGLEKREQYGYWEARLNDGFHFDAVRTIAKKRLEHARRTATLLLNELREDGAM